MRPPRVVMLARTAPDPVVAIRPQRSSGTSLPGTGWSWEQVFCLEGHRCTEIGARRSSCSRRCPRASLQWTRLVMDRRDMFRDQGANPQSPRDELLDAIGTALKGLRRETVGGFNYIHGQASANAGRVLEVATFLYALIEILEQKGILTIEELDAKKDQIADRVERRFLRQGMGVVLQDPDQDKYTFESEARVDCENRVHLCKAACCRMIFPLSRQDVAERILMWDLEAPYLIAQTEDRYCRHLDRANCKCTVREHRPIPCRAYDCKNDARIWSDFANYIINPDLETLFLKRAGADTASPSASQ